MHPHAFVIDLLGVQIHLLPYSLFISLALIVVLVGSWWTLRRDGFPNKPLALLLLGCGMSALIGARILNGILNWDVYQGDPWRWTTLHAMGFSLYGGIILGVISGYALARWMKLDPWRLGDRVAPFLGIGIAFVRMGCYLRGCCFGLETSLPWGVQFPILSPAHMYELSAGSTNFFATQTVHPTQIYEIVGALIASLFSWWIIRKRYPTGVAVLVFALFFTSIRLINYFLRVIPETNITPWCFYPVVYVLLIVSCVLLLQHRLRQDA